MIAGMGLSGFRQRSALTVKITETTLQTRNDWFPPHIAQLGQGKVTSADDLIGNCVGALAKKFAAYIFVNYYAIFSLDTDSVRGARVRVTARWSVSSNPNLTSPTI